jgi:V/A-type H+-transporting ATPase subunit D
MPDREVATTRIALLELQDERRLVREGYQLLDERRMLLAARILRALEELARMRLALAAAWRELEARLQGALAAHGLNELEVWPPRALALAVTRCAESVLGVEIATARAALETGEPAWPPAAPAPAVEDCVAAARSLLALAVPLAALESSLTRLAEEYARTERRTRAIENVLLPELEADLHRVEAALEGLDQEEVVRVHSLRTASN